MISYKYNFHKKVDEFRKEGKTVRESWELCEKLHEIEVGAAKYSSFESFETQYYRYIHKQTPPQKRGLIALK